ncbi:glycosyltransferase [Methylophaga pinxianii]|uniref:glycosyltransferase n=2 Tax=Methylophaga pinxianii TaxID=2881052 RepID=UPI001FFB258D|nr:glycosyltransferase [Methylophaga pinxianii]UPH46137.1 glycosyltransferase [Methylophaga pinxianii]
MLRKTKLKIFYILNTALIALLIGYQVYLNLAETHYASLHLSKIQAIQQVLRDKPEFQFVVVGNINNSSSIFQKQFIPRLNNSKAAFLISAGNAVSDGAEQNYRSLIKMLEELHMPWLLTYGENEDSDFGDFRFFEHFGPPFFSFKINNNQFIFLDNTGNTPYAWQLEWLNQELTQSSAQNRFVFLGLPIHPKLDNTPAFNEDNYFNDKEIAQRLHLLLRKHQVDLVFSANLALYADQTIDGVRYITTGGAGGVIVDDKNSYHHFVEVNVSADGITVTTVIPRINQSSWHRTLTSIWSAIYTFFYVSFARFLVVISFLVLIGLKLREVIYEDRDFYTHFTIDDSNYRDKPKRIAFFTNNFFPFISGVTISIDRLAKGLRNRGHNVHIFAPDYTGEKQSNSSCTRVKTLFAFGSKGEFRLTNPFQQKIRKSFKQQQLDLVHVHHPFWLGSVGLWFAKRYKCPVIYTYHTRLEMYAHYVPLPGALFRNVISHLIIRRFCNKCDGVIVPTYSTEEYLRLVGVKSRIFVQPSGVDFMRFNKPHSLTPAALKQQLGIEQKQLVLVSVSRLGKEKNVKFLIDAIASLNQQTQNQVQLVIIGEGDDRHYLENRIAEKGLQKSIQLIGAVSPENIPGYYQMADIFVFASKSETQGMVILEAMSAGLPVVAIRSSGIDDAIVEGKTGFKTLDDIELWNSKLKLLIEDNVLREELSKQAIEFARQHDSDVFAQNIDKFYSEVLATYHRPSS